MHEAFERYVACVHVGRCINDVIFGIGGVKRETIHMNQHFILTGIWTKNRLIFIIPPNLQKPNTLNLLTEKRNGLMKMAW